MVGVSRSFHAELYSPDTIPEEFEYSEPIGTVDSNVSLDQDENRLLVSTNEFRLNGDPYGYRVWSFFVAVSDWSDIEYFLQVLDHHVSNETPHKHSVKIACDDVKSLEYISNNRMDDDQEPDIENDIRDFEEVSLSVSIGAPWVEFSISPEPDNPIFPSIPIGTKLSLESGVLNDSHLDGLLRLLSESTYGVVESLDLEPLISDNIQTRLENLQHSEEILTHISEGDASFREGRNHLALSSYIHAFEWTAIAFLQTKGIDIIEREMEGNYYHFAGGDSNLLDELRKVADIDQLTISKLKSMNRAERRWMAHHKKGELLNSEVKAIRDRLGQFIKDLFSNNYT